MNSQRLILQLHDCYHAREVQAQIAALRITMPTPLGQADVPHSVHAIAMVGLAELTFLRRTRIETLLLVDIFDVPPGTPLQAWLVTADGARRPLDAAADRAARDELDRQMWAAGQQRRS